MRSVSNSIYAFYYTGPYTSALLPDAEQVCGRLAPARRERFEKQQGLAHRSVTLAAWRLLELAVHRLGYSEFRLADVVHPLDGKPYWHNEAGLEFSLSHARGMAFCAVAEAITIGCDAEERARMNERLTRRLLASTSPRVPCWTEIEAVIKAAGKGIMEGPQIVWSETDAVFDDQRWWCYPVIGSAAHAMHIAANKPNLNIIATEITEL